MIKKTKLIDCAEGPWKNGKGMTRQIAIFPHEATLSENNFDWRLSSATIFGENQFSSFRGRNRWLIIWQGTGVLLNGKELKCHSPYHFAGEEEVNCLPMSEKVIDLGLIYDPEIIQADLKVISHSMELNAEGRIFFLFQAEGSARVESLEMSEGDILFIENKTIQLEIRDKALAYLFSIKTKNHQ